MAQVFHKPIRVVLPEHVDQDDFWKFVRDNMVGKTEFVMKKNRELLASGSGKDTKTIDGVDFIPCLLVSYRDASVVAEMQKDAAGKRTVNMSKTGATAQVMDFNYILISKNNGMAIYQNYSNAASPQVFEDMLRLIYNEYKKAPMQAELEKINQSLSKTKQDKAKREIANKWRCPPEVIIICDNQNDLEKVLSEWSKINSFTYRLSTFAQSGSNWKALNNIVRMRTQKVTFVAAATPLDIIKAVLPIKGDLKLGSFQGVDDTLAKRSLDIFELPRNLAVFEFNDLKVKLDGLVLEDFHTSSVFKWLEATIEPRIADFRDPIEDV